MRAGLPSEDADERRIDTQLDASTDYESDSNASAAHDVKRKFIVISPPSALADAPSSAQSNRQ